MRQVLVDANVLVSYFTDRNESQQRKAEALFRGAGQREHAVVLHTVTLVEMVFVLTQIYDEVPAEVARDLSDLLALPGVLIACEVAWSVVLERWPGDLPSFGDAILATVASEGRYDAVATFDLKLRRKLVRQGTASYW